MSTERPVFLNLMQMKFPPMAIASIFHRISGVVLFLGLPFVLYLLQCIFQSDLNSVNQASVWIQNGMIKGLVWIFLVALTYHLIAGIRHILMDFGIGEALNTARLGAWIVMGASFILAIILGIWLW